MSCIATFYILPEKEKASFFSSKEREVQVEERRFLFLKFRKNAPGEQVWEFLDRVAEKKSEVQFSGFLLVDYLFTYLEMSGDDYFERFDQYYSALSPSGAEKLAAFLADRPVDRAAIERYLEEDGRPVSAGDSEGTLPAYEQVHTDILQWCASIRPGFFGVLHLSF